MTHSFYKTKSKIYDYTLVANTCLSYPLYIKDLSKVKNDFQ